MDKLTISMAIFNSYISHYRRVCMYICTCISTKLIRKDSVHKQQFTTCLILLHNLYNIICCWVSWYKMIGGEVSHINQISDEVSHYVPIISQISSSYILALIIIKLIQSPKSLSIPYWYFLSYVYIKWQSRIYIYIYII